MKPAALELKIPPVLLTIIFAALMWLPAGQASGISIPFSIRLAVLLLCLAATILIGAAAVMSFRKAQTTVNPLTPENCSALVDSGIFIITRNPMYLALLLALIGWGIFLGTIYSLVLVAGYVVYINRFQIQPEERALETAFGNEYLDYKQRVRRWL
jgi:protein-S-isoprenylcysteine O-methyltransferase Ste14